MKPSPPKKPAPSFLLKCTLSSTPGSAARKALFWAMMLFPGVIWIARISPGVTLLDLDSWRDHLARCLADPDYWARGGEADRKYRAANFTGK